MHVQIDEICTNLQSCSMRYRRAIFHTQLKSHIYECIMFMPEKSQENHHLKLYD